MLTFPIKNPWRATLCGIVFAFTQLHCFAQTTSGVTNPQPAAAEQEVPSDPANSTTAVLALKKNESGSVLNGNFFQRLAQFYKQDWAGTNPSTALPEKRGLPAPLDSPPFPSSDWNYGGAPDIGAPDGNTYPVMS